MITGTDPMEELEVPHLKERLWHELAELQAGHRCPPTAPGATDAEPLPRGARRSLRIAKICTAAAAALIVGVVAAQLVGTGTSRPTGPGRDAVLMERIAAANDKALAESIVHMVDDQVAQDGQRLTLELWVDETTGISRMLVRDGQGNPVSDGGPLTGPTIESPVYSGQRVVDYCTRTFVELLDTGDAGKLDIGTVDVRDRVADGELAEDGTELVDGRELIRLRRDDYVLLVDPDTYRPVGQRGTMSLGETFTSTFEYLPRTGETLDLLHPPIPDGFTQVGPVGFVTETSCDGS